MAKLYLTDQWGRGDIMTFRSIVLAGISAASLLMAGAASAAPSFVNGGFEAGASSGWDFMDATNTPGWTLVSSGSFPRLNLNVASGGPYGNNNDLRQFATIGGIEDGETSALEQTISGFVVGAKYTLSWLQSSEFTSADVLHVSYLTGTASAGGDFTSNPYPGSGQFWYGWQTESTTFVANASTVGFRFEGGSTSNYEVGVDKFELSGASAGVPEPTAWAFMLLGFGGLGAMARRRRAMAIA